MPILKFRAFTQTRGKVKRYYWILLHDAAQFPGGQRVIAISPERGYRSTEECQADMELLRRKLRVQTPIEWLPERGSP